MKNALRLLTADEVNRGPNPQFQVVIAYEDFPSGLGAKKLFDQLVYEYGRTFTFHCHLWRFEVLQTPELATKAAVQAKAADMIIISTHEEAEGSDEMAGLLSAWAGGMGGKTGQVLVHLRNVKCGTSLESLLSARLSSLAQQENVTFFALEVDWKDERFDFPIDLETVHPPRRVQSSCLPDQRTDDSERWRPATDKNPREDRDRFRAGSERFAMKTLV